MKKIRILSLALLILGMSFGYSYAQGYTYYDPSLNTDQDMTLIPRQDAGPRDLDRAPAFSSPGEQMAPNGDRTSPYPPYYHPERD